jgi:perosamine synthetase
MTNLFKVYSPEKSIANDIEKIIRGGKLTSGEQVNIFEKRLQEYIGNPYLMVTGSNTYASLITFALCDIKNGDEIIASPMACLASNQPVLNFGAKLVWADIDPATGTMNPEDVKLKITSKTKAILHYHWGGYPGYIDEINSIGRAYGIPVIDDAIEAFGSEYKEKLMGSLGTPFTIFSFQTVRLPNSIDGGAISFADEKQYKKALLMRDFGINRETFRDSIGEISNKSDIKLIGYNAIMNEISGLVGANVINKTAELIKKQRSNAKIWDKYFENNKSVVTLGRAETQPNYWIYSFLTDFQEKQLISFREMGYYASKVHLRNDYYSCFGKFDYTLTGVEEFSKKQLSLPSGWWIDNLNPNT